MAADLWGEFLVVTIRLDWTDQNVIASYVGGVRVYRSGAEIDLTALPAPLAELPVGAVTFDDIAALDGDNHYIVSAFSGGMELFSGAEMVTVSGGVVPWTPADLFVSGENGVWYDPSDLSTLWQDSARTIPVTADGDPVGAMDDKSGNGHHALQANSSKRPVYKTAAGLSWLDFDGADDYLVTSAIDFYVGAEMTAFVGIHKKSDTAFGVIVTQGNINATDRSWELAASATAGDASRRTYRSLVYAAAGSGQYTWLYAAPITNILTSIMDFSAVGASRVDLKVDGANGANEGTYSGGTTSTGYLNAAMHIGSRLGTGQYLNGRVYGMIVRHAVSTTDERTEAESFLATKSGT